MFRFPIVLFICVALFHTIPLHSQAVLNYFTATPSHREIILDWQMSLGQTCDGIRILHSTDSMHFQEIGFIGGICGSKTETVNYQFIHKTAKLNSINHYQLEFGNIGPGETVSVLLLDYSDGYIIYPHPIRTHALLSFPESDPNYQLLVYSARGQIINKLETDQNYFEISALHLPPGFYFFEIINGTGTRVASGKFMKINEH
ncbi:MAG: T9SS type A sorting domain-containing protein [Saprospiraceae bacterium]|nr:T9SS type A sorting domain-containing protein [Saprospiraceae bacterium]